ncbi:hypothetical protein D3C72_2416100 [compost metagenome]
MLPGGKLHNVQRCRGGKTDAVHRDQPALFAILQNERSAEANQRGGDSQLPV